MRERNKVGKCTTLTEKLHFLISRGAVALPLFPFLSISSVYFVIYAIQFCPMITCDSHRADTPPLAHFYMLLFTDTLVLFYSIL